MSQKRLLKSFEILEGDCTHLEVELFYSKGGMNYFTGSPERRGLYVSVQPLTRRENSYGYTAFSGIKQFVKEMGRFNQKALDTFEVDNVVVDKLIEHVVEKNNLKLSK